MTQLNLKPGKHIEEEKNNSRKTNKKINPINYVIGENFPPLNLKMTKRPAVTFSDSMETKRPKPSGEILKPLKSSLKGSRTGQERGEERKVGGSEGPSNGSGIPSTLSSRESSPSSGSSDGSETGSSPSPPPGDDRGESPPPYAIPDDFSDSTGSSSDSELSSDDDSAILNLNNPDKGPKKARNPTLKPIPSEDFSSALTHLIGHSATKSSLKPLPSRLEKSENTLKLERKAKKLLKASQSKHYERGHVSDVIAGWGARPNVPFTEWGNKLALDFAKATEGAPEESSEREKRLKKLAQRGVVRLFNAIQGAQAVTNAAKESLTGATGHQGTSGTDTKEGTIKETPNVLGSLGKAEATTHLSKTSFLQLIREGVSDVKK